MRILIATDAWHPQVNGVVRTLAMTAAAAQAAWRRIRFLDPAVVRTVALPGYPGIRVALPEPTRIAALIAEANPDSIHIATEGPIGLLVRRYCRKHGKAVHDQLSYPLSGLHFGTGADPRSLDMGRAALVS